MWYLSASDRLMQLFGKVLNDVYIFCVDEVGNVHVCMQMRTCTTSLPHQKNTVFEMSTLHHIHIHFCRRNPRQQGSSLQKFSE